jgi:HD-like signal output (HDOD) protein
LALDQYLGAGATDSAEVSESKKQATLEFLLRRMRHKSDFPALSDSVSAINKLTDSDRESINKLSNTILRDYALTNKILRLVNSAYYRQAGGGNISTVSRAVIVLGFDAIRNIAITVLLFEHLQDKSNARELKEAFLRANLAGLLARDTSREHGSRESEEAFICAMFHNLGRLLAQFYFPEEVDTIRILMQQKKINESVAAAQVLGITFEDLGIGIARTWGFPSSIYNAMRKLPDGLVRKAATAEEHLRVISGFANEMCEVIATVDPAEHSRALKAVTDRFSSSLQFTPQQVRGMVEKSTDDLTQVASILHVNLKQSPFARQLVSFNKPGSETATGGFATGETTMDRTLAETMLDSPLSMLDDEEGGEENNGQNTESILTAGIQDISNSLVDDFSLNDILRIILETMYRAVGFKRVMLCLRDPKTGTMVGRFGFGPDTTEVVKTFRFPLAYSADVFHLSTSKGVDILISDIDDPKIADKIPKWYREKVPARTFALFPLMLKGAPVALIYCDKDQAGSIQILERELQLLKTLRNQAILAIKQAT